MISRRLLFGSGGAALLPSAALVQSLDAPVPTTLEELAQRVVDLENRVADLETNAGLNTTGDAESVDEVEVSTEEESGVSLSISGVGTTLSDPLYLEEGMYRVEATISVANGIGDVFNLEVAGSNDFDDWIFMEFAEGNGDFEYSSNWSAKRSEEYFFQVECMSSWTVNFVKLR